MHCEHQIQGYGPKFLDFSHKPGWVLVNCKNQASLNWLVGTAGDIRPWPEATFSIIKESELRKTVTATTVIPKGECESVVQALTLLGAQNKDLNTEVWKTL